MKRRSYTKTQIAIWVISLLVVISMLCGLIGSAHWGAGVGTSMLAPGFVPWCIPFAVSLIVQARSRDGIVRTGIVEVNDAL